MASEQQKDEIIALESIYTKEEFSANEVDGQNHCTLKIFINLPENYCLIYKDTRNPEQTFDRVSIAHLPPLTLLIRLPLDYPAEKPPEFTLFCPWLKRSLMAKLCRQLDKLWEDNKGQEIIFTWVEFLQNEILDFLKIQTNLDVSFAHTHNQRECERAQKHQQVKTNDNCELAGATSVKKKAKPMKSVKKKSNQHKAIYGDRRGIFVPPQNGNVIQALLNYNEQRMCIEFKKKFYTCKICFADKSGESCTQFKPCKHVFCKNCIIGYLEVKITDGAVQNIGCPEEKCTSEASPGQVKLF